MQDKCCTMHDFLENNPEALEHAQTCASCKELAQLVKRYAATRDQEATALNSVLRDAAQQRDANTAVEQMRGISPPERLAWISNQDAASFPLAVALAVEGRSRIYTSPRQTEEWVRLAHEVARLAKTKGSTHASDETFTTARLLTIEGSLAVMRGHIQEAHAHYLRARAMQEELGDEYQAALIVEGLVQTYILQGNAREAVRLGLRTLPVLREHGARRFYVRLFKNLSVALFALGNYERALRISTCVIHIPDVDAESRVMHLGNHALILYALDKHDETEKIANEVLAICTAENRRMEVARNKWLLGELATDAGEYEQARMLLHEATAIFTEEEDLLDAALCKAQLANIALLQGKREEASTTLHIVCNYLKHEGIHYHLELQLRTWLQSIEEHHATALPLGEKAFRAIHALQSPYKVIEINSNA